jgi:hypothetical protein
MVRFQSKISLSDVQRPTRRAGGLGGGPGEIEESKRKRFPFRELVLPPSR